MARQNRRDRIKRNIRGGKGKGRRGRGNQNWATEPLGRKQARHMAGANARAEAAPVINAIKGEREGSRHREKQIGQQFNQLGTNINEAAAQTDSSYQQANAAVMANIEAAQKAAQANQSQIAGGNADFAKLTGADPSAFAQGTQEAANAAAQRALTQTMASAPIAAAGANQAGYLRNVGLNARREGIQQRGLESKRRQKIKQDLTSARKARSQKAVGNFMDLRQGERDYGIQKAAFKLDKSGQILDARSDAADRALDAAKFGETQRHNRATEANARADNKGGPTPSQRRASRREQKSANVAARNLYTAAKKPPRSQAEWAAFIQLVASEEGIDPVAAKKAVAKLRRSLRRNQPQPKKKQKSIVGTVIPGEKITE